jgi:peptidoglycan/LPS O-acetylase OafA/YrhL
VTKDGRTGRAFRPDIEGLRAVAVALVVLFHAGLPWLPGGYVGVDVFFVISGFLITGHLAGELRDHGTISLRSFYARRIRRLLPASALVLVVTVVLAKLFLPPLMLLDFPREVQATALYVPNLLYADRSTDYLADQSPSPLLHYWSLGVEEQFYLFWPMLLLLAGRRRPRPSRRLLPPVGLVAVASLIGCVWLTDRAQPWAFFLLPARAWELAVGASIALVVPRLRRLPATVAAPLSWAGVAAVTLAAVTFTETTRFPGYAALLPVLGAAAVIAGGCSRPAGSPEILLRVAPFQLVGRISYSLYLWHWPLLVIPATARTDGLPAGTRAMLVALAVVLAAATYLWVETPVRTARPLVRRPAWTAAMAVALTGAALVAAATVATVPPLHAGRGVASAGSAVRFVPSDMKPSLVTASKDVPVLYADGCHVDSFATAPKACVYGVRDAAETVVLFGDSHAAQWFPTLQVLAEQHRWRLVTLTKTSCPAADVSVWHQALNRPYTECDTWRRAALRLIAREKPTQVFLSSMSGYGLAAPARQNPEEVWAAGLRKTLSELPSGARAVVIADTPRFRVPPPICLSAHLTDSAACGRDKREAVDAAQALVEREAATAGGARFVDMNRYICPGPRCQVIAGKLLMYRDAHHLTTVYAASLAAQLWQEMSKA